MVYYHKDLNKIENFKVKEYTLKRVKYMMRWLNQLRKWRRV
jgi:hypothetical protein